MERPLLPGPDDRSLIPGWLYELELDAAGWTPVEAVLAALHAERSDWQDLTADDLAELIATSSKRRHEMADGRIRALYGHSVPGKLARMPPTPSERLHHGTSPKALDAIRQAGLRSRAAQASAAGASARECGGSSESRRRVLPRQRESLAGRSRAFAIHRDRRLKTWG